jgi:hypothetical protein
MHQLGEDVVRDYLRVNCTSDLRHSSTTTTLLPLLHGGRKDNRV